MDSRQKHAGMTSFEHAGMTSLEYAGMTSFGVLFAEWIPAGRQFN